MKQAISKESLRRGFEAQDVPARPFLYISGGFVFALLTLLLVLWCLLNLMILGIFPQRQSGASVVEHVTRFPPPEIQTNPGGDFQGFLEAQHKKLNRYGWVDHQRGIVQIPIEEAMNRLLQKGLPVRPPQTGPTEVEMIQQKSDVYPRSPPQ